jgi:hypothetical protein
MKRPILLLSIALIVVVSVLACGDFSTTLRDTAVTLTPDKTTAARGQSFRIRYEVQGRSLNRLVIDYGDGAVDSLGLQGAVTGTGFKDHAYTNAGTFVVTGSLEELGGVEVNTNVILTVTGP